MKIFLTTIFEIDKFVIIVIEEKKMSNSSNEIFSFNKYYYYVGKDFMLKISCDYSLTIYKFYSTLLYSTLPYMPFMFISSIKYCVVSNSVRERLNDISFNLKAWILKLTTLRFLVLND